MRLQRHPEEACHLKGGAIRCVSPGRRGSKSLTSGLPESEGAPSGENKSGYAQEDLLVTETCNQGLDGHTALPSPSPPQDICWCQKETRNTGKQRPSGVFLFCHPPQCCPLQPPLMIHLPGGKREQVRASLSFISELCPPPCHLSGASRAVSKGPAGLGGLLIFPAVTSTLRLTRTEPLHTVSRGSDSWRERSHLETQALCVARDL